MNGERPSPKRLQFDAFEVDLAAGQLRRRGKRIKLQEHPFQVLALLLERPGEVISREELRAKLWARDTFVDFEHGLNKAISKLREALGDSADRPRLIETLPRRGYRFIASVQGREPTGQIRSIAVLPLENLSGDSEQDYFADGMTETLITELGKISALRIISRQSVMQFKGSDKPLPKIARELNVDAVVEGAVLREGERVRITAQLVQAQPEQHLWADNYEREVSGILGLQAELARTIAREVQVRITPAEETRLAAARRLDPKAYEAYLKGRYHWYKLTPKHFEASLNYFQLALEKDPKCALAYTGIADTWGARGVTGVVPPDQAFPKAKAAALKAVELDDGLAEAHNVLARVRFYCEWNWGEAEKEVQWALLLNPNSADACLSYWYLLLSLRRVEEASVQIERALQLDPINFLSQACFGRHLLHTRRYEDAIAQFREILSAEPNLAHGRDGLWTAFDQKGMHAEAVEEAKRFFALLGRNEVAEALARGYAEAGYPGAMRLAAEELAAHCARSYVPPTWIARLYTYSGEKDKALQWLETAYAARDPNMAHLSSSVDWDGLREDPRFQGLLRRMSLPE